ncbi:MAG: D-glycerate dehydrogenase [Gemmatimonadetes bacterium]|nr:D-glycerate dehydrogenase [Gemmatimonadota bacterium]MYH20160.1 D-glycerate dehydrogenase [Gemmatimonadota bacterium]MYK99001.1 D-glycerate dehydrogenase [Gemmatimonadota bacterium]
MGIHILLDVALPDSVMALFDAGDEFHMLDDLADGDPRWRLVDAYLTYGHPPTDGEVMDRMPNLKVISNFGVGVDHIDTEAACERGIPVGNTPHMLDGATADMTFTLLMAAARRVVVGDRFARSPGFTHYDPSILHGYEVHGSTIGIIGMGSIGKQVARRANGFDMEIVYHNRKPDPDDHFYRARYVSLESLLEVSDFVTLNCPLTEETRELIDEAALRRMKKTAILINLARGAVVDHDALHIALSNGWIAAAALDVTEPEPLPRDHPLLRLDNLVIAPHLGSATTRTRDAMARRTVENLKAGLAGRPLASFVV